MLIFTRKIDETFWIGPDCCVQIVAVMGDKVRVGITAPPAVPVHRGEVVERLNDDDRAAFLKGARNGHH